MKLQRTKLGFTLIELLVVITIIGILATGAVGVYTSQIQKARDTTRITDMNALKGGLEQAFQDMGMYPGKATTISATTACNTLASISNSSVHCTVELGFLNALPKDPKDGRAGNSSTLVYTYNTQDLNGVENQTYEISMGVEADGFRTSKAANSSDGGHDAYRVEFGIPGVNINTCAQGVTACSNVNDTANTVTAVPLNSSIKSCTILNATIGQVVIRGACE